MSVANCPGCGAPVEFAIGSSIVAVCHHCRSLVARTDRGVEDLGKVAALIDTGSPLQIGLTGKHRGRGFRLTGRTQLRHESGAVWDEWYAAFDDGRWGWLAEAQAQYFITFRTAETGAPRYEELDLGMPVPSIENMVVGELGGAVLASAEGELPWKPQPSTGYLYADLSGTEDRFATIDYSEEKPLVFKGWRTTLHDLGITAKAAGRARVAVTKLSCTNCGGPLELRAPDQAERIYCPNCGAGHDIANGNLQFFAMLKKKKVEPLIAIGSTGTLDGDAYVVTGFLQRSVKFDIKYYWTEYLLFNRERGFRWLVESDDHWSFVTPVPVGEVTDGGQLDNPAKKIGWKGKWFSIFQVAEARVEYVLGEFYWKVTQGEKVGTIDYIRPPEGMSTEITLEGAREVNYSHARYVQPEDVQKAFAVNLKGPSTVGPMQLFPGPNLAGVWVVFVMLLFALAIFIGATRSGRVVSHEILEPKPSAEQPNGATFFGRSFELKGNENLRVLAHSGIANNWVYVEGDLLHEGTGAMESFALPIEYYSGVSDGERWSEGDQERSVFISAPEPGRYTTRYDVTWDPNNVPSRIEVRISQGVFRWSHFLLALIALSIIPVITLVNRFSWEAQRWKDSDFSPFGQGSSDESDDEEDE